MDPYLRRRPINAILATTVRRNDDKRRRRKETRTPLVHSAIVRNIRESVGRARDLSCFALTRYISADSLDLYNQILISEREMSGNIFLPVSSEVRATSIRLVLSPRPVLFAILYARDVDEMSSRLIFLWLMWTLINNSFLMKCPRVLRNLVDDVCFEPSWIVRKSAESFAKLLPARSISINVKMIYSAHCNWSIKRLCDALLLAQKLRYKFYTTVRMPNISGSREISTTRTVVPIDVKKRKKNIPNFTREREKTSSMK